MAQASGRRQGSALVRKRGLEQDVVSKARSARTGRPSAFRRSAPSTARGNLDNSTSNKARATRSLRILGGGQGGAIEHPDPVCTGQVGRDLAQEETVGAVDEQDHRRVLREGGPQGLHLGTHRGLSQGGLQALARLQAQDGREATVHLGGVRPAATGSIHEIPEDAGGKAQPAGAVQTGKRPLLGHHLDEATRGKCPVGCKPGGGGLPLRGFLSEEAQSQAHRGPAALHVVVEVAEETLIARVQLRGEGQEHHSALEGIEIETLRQAGQAKIHPSGEGLRLPPGVQGQAWSQIGIGQGCIQRVTEGRIAKALPAPDRPRSR